jgi:hypothetical protein
LVRPSSTSRNTLATSVSSRRRKCDMFSSSTPLTARIMLGVRRASRAPAYGAVGALLSWSFTTLAVAAKNVMTSVIDYLLSRRRARWRSGS